jgi:hypothetical protein
MTTQSAGIKVNSAAVGGVAAPILNVGQLNNAYQSGLESSVHVTLKTTNTAGNFYFYKQSSILASIIDGDFCIGQTAVIDSSRNLLNLESIKLADSKELLLGTSSDVRLLHNGTDTHILNNTGDLFISNFADDKDIVFRSDDGSGGVTEYFRLDGSLTKTYFEKNVQFNDSVKIQFGAGADLSLNHNGTHSFIDNNTGSLYISSTTSVQIEDNSGNDMITAGVAGAVTLFHNGSSKLATTSGGVDVTGEILATSTITSNGKLVSTADGSEGGHLLLRANSGGALQYSWDVDSSNAFRMIAEDDGTGANGFVIMKTGSSGQNIRFQKSLRMINTEFMDTSRNMSNIGTISSGAITSTGSSTFADTLTVSGASQGGIRLISANTQTSFVDFGDAQDSNVGLIAYDHSVNEMFFRTNATEALRFDSSQNATFAGTIAYSPANGGDLTLSSDSTYGTVGSGEYVTLGFGGKSNGYNRIFGANTTDGGLFIASATGRNITFRTNGGTANTFAMTSGGLFQVNDTTILDQSRNLSSIGTISSGAITASGAITSTVGVSRFQGGLAVGGDNDIYFYESTVGNGTIRTGSSGAYKYFTFESGGNFNITGGGLEIGSQEVIQAGTRNLTNIGTITATQNLTLNASGTSDTSIEIGANTASNHYAFIDLVGDATYSDYGLRIIRNNGGANTSSFIYHRGTGNFNIETQDSASIKLRTAGVDALTLNTTQDATFAGNITTSGNSFIDVNALEIHL